MSRENTNKNRTAGINLKGVFVFLGIIAVVLTFYIAYISSLSERKLFSLSLVALFAGLLFESFRITDKWKNVVYKFIGVYCLSFISFYPYRGELNYNLDNHIEMWPYSFLGIFLFFSVFFNKDKVTAKLTEGITLLLSISFLYWLFDLNVFSHENLFSYALILISVGFCAFSLILALTDLELTRVKRLWLSIWSTVVIFSISIDNGYQVFKNGDLESSKYISDNLLIGIQYFLLGVSSMYIMRNFLLLMAFLPSKNGNYRSDLRDNINDHINRFSEEQVSMISSLLCVLYACTCFYANYKYDILPRNTMIWLVIFSFPLWLGLFELLKNRSKAALLQKAK
ncbi:hypothetical protein [Pedobacter gandavensis]|uniref:hypothetical protein n=1 Tax=Pedobacter gandavensis TaxID=2679963 RepID=UPI0029303CDC|nr:hypothetical protein [Pedobacter gandavensis]